MNSPPSLPGSGLPLLAAMIVPAIIAMIDALRML